MHIPKPAVAVGALLAALSFITLLPAQTAPDNTRANKGDQVTADSQKANKTDTTLTKNIRKAVTTDKSLSSYAHNVKIIAQNGAVTLKGPVRSDEEKKTIVAKAVEAAGGADKVTDEMTVMPAPASKEKQ